MTSDLSRLTEVFGIAKRCYRVIMFSFWGTIVVDTLGIGLAFLIFWPPSQRRCPCGFGTGFHSHSARLFRSSVQG